MKRKIKRKVVEKLKPVKITIVYPNGKAETAYAIFVDNEGCLRGNKETVKL